MGNVLASGAVRKMKTTLDETVSYSLPVGDSDIAMNGFIGKQLRIEYQGSINCIHCARKTNKSFSQGYCYPCFKRLAQCDTCIVSPEKCHYDAGSCREPEWGKQNCMIDHFVYLANTSGLKVGITRGTQVPTRWMDQGATQARPVFRVATRLDSGLVETVFKNHIADKTNWRTMLKGAADPVDLEKARQALMVDCADDINTLISERGVDAVTELPDEPETLIQYPVIEYPVKVSSFNLDKTPVAEGTLMGIKGQYLIFDAGVINMRKYAGYHITLMHAG